MLLLFGKTSKCSKTILIIRFYNLQADHILPQSIQSLPQTEAQPFVQQHVQQHSQPVHPPDDNSVSESLPANSTNTQFGTVAGDLVQPIQLNNAVSIESADSSSVMTSIDGQNMSSDSPSSTTSLMEQIQGSRSGSGSAALVKAPPTSAPASTVASKSRRSNKSTERIPKLVVMSVQNGTLVDCSMENIAPQNKLKTITFKFDISDVNPVDVANDLVSVLEYYQMETIKAQNIYNIFF